MGAAWERHAMCESPLRPLFYPSAQLDPMAKNNVMSLPGIETLFWVTKPASKPLC